MARWERLEEYLYDHEKQGSEFTVFQYAESADIEVQDATQDIQSHLNAQRTAANRDAKARKAGMPEPLFVLRRVSGTRTRSARWAVGTRTADARAVGRSFSDDVRTKALRAFRPDLLEIAAKNPRAARQVEAAIAGVLDHALKLLDMAAQGMMPDADDE